MLLGSVSLYQLWIPAVAHVSCGPLRSLRNSKIIPDWGVPLRKRSGRSIFASPPPILFSPVKRLLNSPRLDSKQSKLETEDEVGAQGNLGKVQGHLRIGDPDPRRVGGYVAHLQPDRRRRLRQGLYHQASEIQHEPT